jgi:hypothetical protein
MKKAISIILSGGISIGLATLLQYGFESSAGGYWILLFVGGSLLGWLILVTLQKKPLRADVYALALLLLGLAASFFLRAGWFAGPLRVFLLMYGYILLAEATYNGKISYAFWKGLFPTILFAPIRYLTSFGPALSDIKWKSLKTDVDLKSQHLLRQWGGGILLTIPFLFIFIILLSGVNPLFADIFNLTWITTLLESLPQRVAPIAIYTWLFWGCYVYMFELPYIKAISPFKTEDPLMDTSSISRSLFIIVLFFGLYLFIDLPYLWGGYDNFLSADRVQTLADYAKRGFYEILAVLVFSFLYIRVTDLVTKGQSLTKNGKIVFGLLIVELFLLLLSAFTRLDLYIAEYGWTEMRLLGMYYLILFLGGLAIMTIYRFKDWSWSRLERIGVLWVYFWLVCISLLPNTAIATRLHIVWSERTEIPIDIYWVTNPNPVEASVYIDIIENNHFQEVEVDAKKASPYTEGDAIYPLSDMMACVLHMRKREETLPHPRYEHEWKEQTLFNLNRESEIAKKTFENFDLHDRDCNKYGLYY